MKKANISETKNGLSALIARVRHGETVIIMDRETPVARLEPVAASDVSGPDLLAQLARRGSVEPPRRPLDVTAFLRRKMAALGPGASAVRALVSDRADGR